MCSRRRHFAGMCTRPKTLRCFLAACCLLTLSQSSHWSCCGVLQREAPCKLVGAAAEVLPISDDVTSADIDSIMQARPQISSYCFVRLLRLQFTP